MKNDHQKRTGPGKSADGAGPLTREKVRARARVLASMEGRTPMDVTQSDYEQAKRELTGQSGFAQQEALLDRSAEEKSAIASGKPTTKDQKPG